MGICFSIQWRPTPTHIKTFYMLIDDIKNARILLNNSGATPLERTLILIELERAENKVKGILNPKIDPYALQPIPHSQNAIRPV